MFVLLTLGWLPSWDNIEETDEQDSVQGVHMPAESGTWAPAAGMGSEFRPSVRACRALVTWPGLHSLKPCRVLVSCQGQADP